MLNPPPWWQSALRCRCPRCGKAPLYAGLLTVRDRCPACDLDLRAHDSGDGPAVLVMFLLGTILVVGAFYVEFHFSPPFWVHAVLWPTLSVPLAILLMRIVKAALVALQFRNRSSEMGL